MLDFCMRRNCWHVLLQKRGDSPTESRCKFDAGCKTTATWPPCIFCLTRRPQIQYKLFIIRPIIDLQLVFRRTRTRALQFEIILLYMLHTNLRVLNLLLLLYQYISVVLTVCNLSHSCFHHAWARVGRCDTQY